VVTAPTCAKRSKNWDDAEPLSLDFSGVRIASVSFFDESLGLLAKKRPVDELKKRARVENIEEGESSTSQSHRSVPCEGTNSRRFSIAGEVYLMTPQIRYLAVWWADPCRILNLMYPRRTL
jgi:hypothetical protein